MRKPLIPIAAALCASILLGRFVDIHGEILLLCALAVVIVYILGRVLSVRPMPIFFFAAALLALFGAGASSREEFRRIGPDNPAYYTGRGKLSLEAVAAGSPVRKEDGVRLPLKVEKIHLAADAFVPVQGGALLTIAKGGGIFRYGDRLRFDSRVRGISPYGNPGAFRADRFYREEGIDSTVYVRSDAKIDLMDRGNGNVFLRSLERLRTAIRARLDAQIISPQREIVKALVLGETDGIPDEVRRAFRDAGISHLLAVSGLHIGIIASTFFLLIFAACRRSSRLLLSVNAMKLSAGLSLIPTVAYCLLAGAKFPSIRAAIMVAVYLLALVLDRHRDILSAIALAAIAILATHPESLYEPGFQLSFAAVTAIVLVVPRVLKWRRERRDTIDDTFPTPGMRASDWLIAALVTPVAAGIATAPITAWHFGGVSVFGLLTNVLLVPLYSLFIIPVSFAGVIVAPLSVMLSQFVFNLIVYAINTGYRITTLVASLPGAYAQTNTPTLWEIAAFYGLIVSLYFFRKKFAARLSAAACVVVLVAVPAAYRLSDWLDEDVRFTLIDVGQGLSQLIELPGGKKILVDGGGAPRTSFDVGDKVLRPFFRKRRIGAFDLVISTHPHPDHYTGLDWVVRNCVVREMWISGLEPEAGDTAYPAMLAAAKERGIPVHIVDAETPPRAFGPVKLSILWPPGAARVAKDIDLNDASLVMRLDNGKTSFLLPADTGSKTETILTEGNAPLRATVLVVGHHGSADATGAPFLAAVQPEFALISAGRDNRYGHPKPVTLSRLLSARVKIFRTDLNGQIRCRSDAVRVACEPFWATAGH